MEITDKQILKKAEAFEDKRDLEENRHIPATQRLGIVEGYQQGYKDCLEENRIKFDTSFEALYKIGMSMADTCIVNKPMEKRFAKLEEEYKELIEIFDLINKQERSISKIEHDEFVHEMADVLFVLLHIAHQFAAETPFSLLHYSMTKMLGRMNDPNYVAKI